MGINSFFLGLESVFEDPGQIFCLGTLPNMDAFLSLQLSRALCCIAMICLLLQEQEVSTCQQPPECLFITGWERCSFLSDEPSYVVFATILSFSSCV